MPQRISPAASLIGFTNFEDDFSAFHVEPLRPLRSQPDYTIKGRRLSSAELAYLVADYFNSYFHTVSIPPTSSVSASLSPSLTVRH
jgi:hypothetical protein